MMAKSIDLIMWLKRTKCHSFENSQLSPHEIYKQQKETFIVFWCFECLKEFSEELCGVMMFSKDAIAKSVTNSGKKADGFASPCGVHGNCQIAL